MVFCRQARLTIVAAVALCACGCRAGGVGNFSRINNPPPASVAERPVDPTAEYIVGNINRNARLVQSLSAQPAITVYVGQKKERHPLNGRMGFERPRNFRLVLSRPSIMNAKEADIGSNADEFWFWVARNESKEVYIAPYDEAGDSPLEVALQPDWIVEAMGLREIPESEVRAMKVRRGTGTEAGMIYLSRSQRAKNGQVYTKLMLVEQATGNVREHRLYENDQKLPLAKAIIPPNSYRQFPLASAGSGAVMLPSRMHLEWAREQLALDVTMDRADLNVALGGTTFDEPEFAGFARVDLSKQPGRDPTTVRETRPAPPAGVRLDHPQPLSDRRIDRRSRRQTRPSVEAGDPWPLTASFDDTGYRDALVGTTWPKAPEPEFLRPGSAAWATAPVRNYEP